MLLPFRKRQTKYRPRFTLQLPRSAELASQDFHDLEAQRLALSGGQILGHTDAVVDHRQFHSAAVALHLDPGLDSDEAATSLRKRVLECVGNSFVEYQTDGHRLIHTQDQRRAI